MAVFTHVIPIGANCRLTTNVRRHFDHAESYPFDWWILPLPALIALLRTGLDPDRLYDPAFLRRVPDEAGAHRYVEHAGLGIRFVHEFPGMPARADAPVAWAAHVEKPRARLRYLGDRLRGLNAAGHALLFVRFCVDPGHGIAPDTDADLEVLRPLLAGSFPEAAVDLVAISPSGRIGAHPTLAVDDRTEDWRGDITLWSRALATTGHSLRNPTIRPFVWRASDIDAEGALPPDPPPGKPAGWLGRARARLRARHAAGE